jgi:hypothetical protein
MLFQRISKNKTVSSSSNNNNNKIVNPLKNYSWQQDAALFGINWHKIKEKILKNNPPVEVMDGLFHLFEEGKTHEVITEREENIELNPEKQNHPITALEKLNKTFMIKKKKLEFKVFNKYEFFYFVFFFFLLS